MSIASRQVVPLGYRAAFFIFDFVFPLGGIFGHLFAPGAILAGFTGNPVLPPAVETQVILDGMAGWYAGLAALHIWLQLYHPKNRAAWRPIIAQLVLVDIGMLVGFTRALSTEGRLFDFAKWRNEDFSNIIGYTLITMLRIVFAAMPTVSNSIRKDRKGI